MQEGLLAQAPLKPLPLPEEEENGEAGGSGEVARSGGSDFQLLSLLPTPLGHAAGSFHATRHLGLVRL